MNFLSIFNIFHFSQIFIKLSHILRLPPPLPARPPSKPIPRTLRKILWLSQFTNIILNELNLFQNIHDIKLYKDLARDLMLRHAIKYACLCFRAYSQVSDKISYYLLSENLRVFCHYTIYYCISNSTLYIFRNSTQFAS